MSEDACTQCGGVFHRPLSHADSQHDIDELRYRLRGFLIGEIARFSQSHHDVRVEWDFTLVGRMAKEPQ